MDVPAPDSQRSYLAPLRRWAHGRLPAGARDLLATDDLVQETLLRTLKHIEGFEPRVRAPCRPTCGKRSRLEFATRSAARRARQAVKIPSIFIECLLKIC